MGFISQYLSGPLPYVRHRINNVTQPFQLTYVTYLFVSVALISLVLYLKNIMLSKICLFPCVKNVLNVLLIKTFVSFICLN